MEKLASITCLVKALWMLMDWQAMVKKARWQGAPVVSQVWNKSIWIGCEVCNGLGLFPLAREEEGRAGLSLLQVGCYPPQVLCVALLFLLLLFSSWAKSKARVQSPEGLLLSLGDNSEHLKLLWLKFSSFSLMIRGIKLNYIHIYI